MTMQEKDTYLSRWRTLAEQLLGWGNSGEWTDQDFEKLGDLVLTKTGTLLSLTTLKRIWGRVKYDSSPTAATLNAMARFVGDADWRAFKVRIDAERQTPALVKVNGKPQKKYLPLAVIGVVMLILIGVAIGWHPNPKMAVQKYNANAPIKFIAKKVTDDLPNSVVFNYDASKLGVDSVTLQQTWDEGRTERIPANGKQHTSIYYYPGYFNAKLKVNNHTLIESPVFIKTKGWAGIIETAPIPTYLSSADIHLPGTLGINARTLSHKTNTVVFNNLITGFYNVADFGHLSGSNFSFETTLRNTSTAQQAACRKVVVYILGTQNAIIIPLSDKGCISSLALYTSSEWISGKEKDLSAFGCDFKDFQKLSCSIKDLQIRIGLNGKTIFTAPITQTIKNIAGICIAFEGTGEVKSVKLGDGKRTVIDDRF